MLEEFDAFGEVDRVQAAFGEQGVDFAVHGEPVGEVADLVPALRDRPALRAVGDMPVVDRVGDQGDAPRCQPGPGGEQEVLVGDPGGETEPVVEEERPAIALVGGKRVPDQRIGVVGERVQHSGLPVDPPVPGFFLASARGGVDADAQAGDKVRSGGLDRPYHGAAGVAVQFVVAVQEHHIAARSPFNAVVAGLSAASAVGGQAECADPVGVAFRESLGYRETPVGAVVVDDDGFHAPAVPGSVRTAPR